MNTIGKIVVGVLIVLVILFAIFWSLAGVRVDLPPSSIPAKEGTLRYHLGCFFYDLGLLGNVPRETTHCSEQDPIPPLDPLCCPLAVQLETSNFLPGDCETYISCGDVVEFCQDGGAGGEVIEFCGLSENGWSSWDDFTDFCQLYVESFTCEQLVFCGIETEACDGVA